MSKIFPQESSEAFFNIKSLHYAEQKTLHQRVLAECFEKHFRKKKVWFGFSKKKLFSTLPPLLRESSSFLSVICPSHTKNEYYHIAPPLIVQSTV